MNIKHLHELIEAYDQAAQARRENLNDFTSLAYFQALRKINDAGGWEKIAKALLAMVEQREVRK